MSGPRYGGARAAGRTGLAAALAAIAAWSPAAAPAQEPPPAPQPAQQAGRRCDLTWQPTSDQTVGRIFRETPEAGVTYVSGGMIWTCGTATMEADSAEKYDLTRLVKLFGSVRYRDTIRTLDSDSLTYLELADRIVAVGNVFLTRITSGSTLEGPRVEFLRAVSGIEEVTVATGRPHMVLRPQNDPEAPPFEVDADVAEFLGEDEARARGAVEIRRPDLTAAADSAHFRLEEGTGVMYGDPWVEGEAFRLEGDTIHIAFEARELRSVRAVGTGTATGEAFEVISEEIDVAVADDEVDEVWAFGPGRSLAISGGHRLYGDSLRFVMWAGRIDSVIAVGQAAAVQPEEAEEETSDPAAEPAETEVGGAEAGAEPEVPPLVEAAAEGLPPEAEAEGEADPQAAAAEEPPPPIEAEEERQPPPEVKPELPPAETPPQAEAEAEREAEQEEERAPPVETPPEVAEGEPGPEAAPEAAGIEAERPEVEAREAEEQQAEASEAESQAAEGAPPGSGRVPEPRLSVDARANWAAGDTLYAIFVRPGRDASPDTATSRDTIASEPAAAPPDAPGAARDTLAGAEPDAAAADTTQSQIEKLRVVGNARSFYSGVRDTLRGNRPSRNYLIGRAIEIVFENGEAKRVFGEQAIGVYLDPADVDVPVGPVRPGAAGRQPGTGAPDSLRAGAAGADSVRADSVRADSVRADSVRADSIRADSVRADSVRADSVRADSVRADSVRADSARADSTRSGSPAPGPVRAAGSAARSPRHPAGPGEQPLGPAAAARTGRSARRATRRRRSAGRQAPGRAGER